MLMVAIQDYANEVSGTPIGYGSGYPYFFVDTNGDGEIGEDGVNYGNRYNAWTPRLLRAAYNYQYVAKDLGAFSHNPSYVIQLLQDSLEDLGGDVSGMERP